MENLQGSLGILQNGAVLQYLLNGVVFTILIAVSAILISIVIGSVFAVCRNYCTHGPARLLGWGASVYIEIFRNTPLMLWMFVALVFFKIPLVPDWLVAFLKLFTPSCSTVEATSLVKMMIALTLFTSSVMAEIIRGGLNSVSRGQIEAGYSQGFSFPQIMLYIVLPQAFRNIIPTMLSQAITAIKDSSYIAIAGLYFEFMARIKLIVNQANKYNGTWKGPMERGTINVSDVFVLFAFAFLVYFVINFTLSCIVRYIQKKRLAAV